MTIANRTRVYLSIIFGQGEFMADEVMIILDLSQDVQTLLEQQGVNLFQELQREIPAIHFTKQADPNAPPGSRDIVTVISVTTGLVGALTPIILRILNMITPPNRSQTWIVEETEMLHPDGSRTIHRKKVLSNKEQRLPDTLSEQLTKPQLSSPAEKTDSNK